MGFSLVTGCAMIKPKVQPSEIPKLKATSPVKRVAVVPFENVSGYFGVDEQFTKILVYQLSKSGYKVSQQSENAKPQDADLLIRGTVEKVVYFTSLPLDWYWQILPPWWIQAMINIFYEEKNCIMVVNTEIIDMNGKTILSRDFEANYVTPNTNETSSIVSNSNEIISSLLTAL